MTKPFNCSNSLLCPDGGLRCKFTMNLCTEVCSDKFKEGHAKLYVVKPREMVKIRTRKVRR